MKNREKKGERNGDTSTEGKEKKRDVRQKSWPVGSCDRELKHRKKA